MPLFKIPINWEVYGVMEIEAENIEEAIIKAEDHPYPPIKDNTEGSLEVNFELIEHLNPGVEMAEEPLLTNGILNIRCPKCGKFLHRTETDGMWCKNRCYNSEYEVWKAVQESMFLRDAVQNSNNLRRK